MKEKLVAELKKKYAGQLTTKFIENLADRLSEKVEKEEDIEGVISELEQSPIRVQDLQAEGDRRATDLKKQIEELQDKIKQPTKPTDPPKPPRTDTSELEQKLADLERKWSQREARNSLIEKAKEKRIPQVLLNNVQVDDPEKVDEVLQRLEEQSSALKQEMIKEGLVTEPPKRPQGGADDKKQTRDDIEKFKIKKSQTKKE